MKNYSYIGISFIVLVFGIIFIPKIIDRFSGKTDLMVIGKVPHFSFTNQNNEIITEEDYEGKVYVLEFFFANCPSICPVMNENLVKIQNHFKLAANFGIVSITIDPDNDTPEALKTYAERIGVTSKNWNLLTGDQETIYGLAEKFHLYAGANPDAPGGFEHSGLFALIDKDGKIRCRKDDQGNPVPYYDGTEDESIRQLKEDIKKLIEE